MHSRGVVAVALSVFSSCATTYAYRFDAPGSDDADLAAQLSPDPSGQHDIVLALTNHTTEPVQVSWAKITVTAPDGRVAGLRPDVDLGRLPPGQTQQAHLGPFALPFIGEAALANDNALYQLQVPLTVRHQPRVLHFTLVAHVQPAKGSKS